VQAIQLRPGTYYSKTKQNITLNRLVTLGAFKFVKNEFSVDTAANKLNVTYLLTPYAKKSFNGEFGGFTQNDSRGGVRASITWKNKNLFKGAEVFSIKGFGSFEAQFGGENNTKRPNAYNFGIETNLSFPRFIVPFFKVKPSGMYIPRTIVSASYNYSLRQDFYRVNSVNLGAGYNWKEEIRKDHKLFPLNITAVKTDTINAANSSQFNFSNLIFNGIILGPTYEYTFNSQLDGVTRTNNYYFNGLLDLSGNILGLVQGAKQNDKKQLLGTNYAQYIKIQTDFRYYRKTNSKSTVALRAFAGFGYSYGNSYTLPNVKLFFSGGSSSLRGFAARLVGPGTFHQDASQIKTFEILGDIKGELNAEYRWKFYKFLELGAFVDAGNIWLLRDNPTFPGGTFSNQFYKEIAMDMGLGLRLDLSILLVRFDFAIPIRKPWYPEGERWRFNDIRFASPEWRNENLYFNLAIGYPF
jgi:outer membrane protein insertion porin family